MNKMVGKNMQNVKFERKNRVITLRNVNTTKNNTTEVRIDPTMIFQRICILKKSNADIEECFTCE